MDDRRLRRVATRLAAAVLRRARRYRERLFAPDAFQGQVEAAVNCATRTDLRGLVVAISGSSRGVGFVIAKALTSGGAKVVINGRDASRVERAAAVLRAAGGTTLAVMADVSTVDGARRFINETVTHFGRIDVLINNAGVAGPTGSKPWDMDPAAFEPVLAANLCAPFLCAREAMRWMTAHAVAGRIVNVSSGAGRTAASGMAPYVASKFGLEGLTRALALDADGTGILVCAIQLGTLRTDMTRALMRWEDHQDLPPPETAIPVFMHAITGAPEQVAGKTFAAWRFDQDAEAEAVLAQPLVSFPRFAFGPIEYGGRELVRGQPGVRAVDRAENPLGMPQRVRDLLSERGHEIDFSRYPDPSYRRLREALSARLSLPADDFTFGPGSAELVERIVRIFGGCGEDVLANDPTWFIFDRYCAMSEVRLRKIPVRQREADGPFDHNLEALAKAITPRTRMIYLINPSNPLGNGIDRREFIEFLKAVPKHIPVVVDEAYVEFSENPDMLRTHELVATTDRLLIGLRTFSKFYGLAGLRIGYAFGTPRAMRLLNRLEHVFCISTMAEEAALAALADEDHARATRNLLRVEKARIRARLARAGLAALPSEAHFMMVECPTAPADSDRVWGAFVEAGIIIPRGLVFDRYLMLPVVLPPQNDRHLEILLAAAPQREPLSRAVG